jgi:two-component system CheB/CheR fusion protein
MTRDSSRDSTPYHVVHQTLLERYAPPSILVGPDDKLIHVSEHAGRYLIHPGGEVTMSVLKLVREELRIELQSQLRLARQRKRLVDSAPILVRFDGHSAPVVMHIRPAQELEQDGFVLIIFEEHQPDPNDRDGRSVPGIAASESTQDSQRIAELESELNAARQRLQSLIEEHETSQEEMKASNEEMQSTNEELRSTMEELETSKEELQSINEELQTVNQENRHKIEELSQLTSDLQNLFAATEIATLFLDRDLRIMRFTPRLSELFNI